MTNQRPTVPSPEQVDQWFDDAVRLNSTPKYYIARQSALWSADRELEACVEWLQDPDLNVDTYKLCAARRPKPPNLKELALEALREAESSGCLYVNGRSDTIRKALEALPE